MPPESSGHHGGSADAETSDTDPTLPDEMSLCKFWNAARLPISLRTMDGSSLDVIYPGQWSYGHGPDFRNAILCFDNARTIRGDVEVHVRSSGWQQHGHQDNPLYEHVVLHVVWRADPRAPMPAPVLEISAYVPLQHLHGWPPPGRLDESLCDVFATKASADRAVRVIEGAGDARFEARCTMFEGELSCEPAEEVLYAGLMECMGYSENRLPFRLLAQSVPYAVLGVHDPLRIARRLQAASGLEAGAERESLLRPEQWNIGRVRPANHPLRRMEGLAHLLARSGRADGLVEYLAGGQDDLDAGALIERLRVRCADGPAYIGPDRAVEAACNVVLPFATALARRTGERVTEEWAREVWKDLPRASVTRIERLMREHLDVPNRSKLLCKVRHQQGLLHLYRRYCAHRLCDACPLSRIASEQADSSS